MRRLEIFMLVVPLAVAAGCEEATSIDDTGRDDAVIVGRVDEVRGEIAPTEAFIQIEGPDEEILVFSAPIGGDGSFRMESVPTGRADLVVRVSAEGEAPTGSVLVHEQTRSRTTVTVASIDAETTLEARVIEEVDPSGPARRNVPGLMAFVRAGGTLAELVAGSPDEVVAMADAWVASEGVLTGSFNRLDVALDLEARQALLEPLVADYAALRHFGVSAASAHPLLISAMLDAFAEAGASDVELALVTAASGTAAMHTSALPAPATALFIVREAALLNLEARERLLREALTEIGGPETFQVLQIARASVEAAATPADVVAALATARAAAAEVLEVIYADLAEIFSPTVRVRVRVALQDAIDEADLESRLRGRGNATAILPVVDDYESELREAVDDFAFELPLSVDTDAMTAILAAGGAGGWLER